MRRPGPLAARGLRLAIPLLLAALLPGAAARADLDARQRAALAGSPRVEPAVVEALASASRARVLVAFEPPAIAASLAGRLRRSAEARQTLRRALGERRRSLLAGLSPASFSVERRFDAVPALVLAADPSALVALLADPRVLAIGLDARVEAQLNQARPLVGLDALHARGPVGADVQMALLDTGVDKTHTELAGAVIAEQCFCDDGAMGPFGCCPDGSDEQSGSGAADDDHGHGTRVAGIAAARGVVWKGSAPAAEIVAVKVLDAAGGGLVSDVVLGLSWLLMNRPDVDVVNLSLAVTGELWSGDCDTASADAIALAAPIDALRAEGVLTVAGSGNAGDDDAMHPPACIANAVSVGAVWDADVGSQTVHGCTDVTTAADQPACFSNSSATTDLFAPGGSIITPTAGGGTAFAKGTSYAAPFVAGCAAALIDARPWVGIDDLEAALETSPVEISRGAYAFPRLDCDAAFAELSTARLHGLRPAGLAALAATLIGLGLARLRGPGR